MENISATRERKEKIVETPGVGGERSFVPENATVVQSVYDAFGRGDVQALFGLFHPKGEIYQSSRLPWGGVYREYAGLGDFLGKLTGVVESRVDTERYIDDEEGYVVAVGHTG